MQVIDSVTLEWTSRTYSGTPQKPGVKEVASGGVVLAESDYKVAYSNAASANAGTYEVTVTGVGDYTGSVPASYTIKKASQAVSAKNVKVTYKGKKLVKGKKLAKNQSIKLASKAKVSAKTAVTYKKANNAGGSKIKVNGKTGVVSVKKGLKVGTYNVKVKLTAGRSTNYEAAKAKTITVKVVVKK